MSIDFLTVVYRDELMLLQMQAQSFAWYIDSKDFFVTNFYVILNDDTLTYKDIDISWWGPHASKVQIINRNEFGYYPPPYMKGWYTQQLCKILGTVHAQNEWCFIFDAKTLLIQHLEYDTIFTLGRGRFANWPCTSPHWQTGLQFLKEKYSITNFKWISPGGVPFLAHVPTMRAMVCEEPDFVEWFHTYCQFPHMLNNETRGITEFLCYSAYVSSIKGRFEELYTGEQAIEVYNLADWEVKDFDSWIKQIRNSTPFTVSIHPRAYNLLNEEQKIQWEDLLIGFNVI
jgi:Family of unknown function (DUF6492)